MRSPVTFLMPVRNGRDFLIDSLENIDAMADSSDEILVINDHSSDGTDEILHSMKSIIKNLVVLNNPNSGLVKALNFGLEEASNNLIARVDVDDTYQIDRINKQIDSFTPSTVAVFSDYTFVSPDKSNLGTIYSAVHPLAVSASLVSSQRTAHPSVVFSREAVIQVGGYRESDFPAEDLSLWLRLSRVGELRSVPLPLLNYRINPQGISATRRSEMLMKKTSLLSEIILINNASYTGSTLLNNWAVDFKDQDSLNWDRAIQVGLTSAFELSKAFQGYLKKNKGVCNFYILRTNI